MIQNPSPIIFSMVANSKLIKNIFSAFCNYHLTSSDTIFYNTVLKIYLISKYLCPLYL